MRTIVILTLFLWCGTAWAEDFLSSATCDESAQDCVVEDTVKWLGHPMLSDNDPYTPAEFWTPGYLIGLRSDGVVVWKENKA